MAAPRGNKFWKLRSTHGRDALFASADLLWEAACQYFEWCDKNPLIEVEQVKSPGKGVYDKKKEAWVFPPALVELPKMRAWTLKALCIYLGCNAGYFNNFKGRLKKSRPKDMEFLEVITRIEDTIYVQKFEGAAAGFLKENLISRELGLVDKQQVDANVNGKVAFNGKVEVTVKSSGVPLGNDSGNGEETKR